MVVGDGQLAKAFSVLSEDPMVVVFASGVSNSNGTRKSEFDREKALLRHHLRRSTGKKFVYFSSCALADSLRNKSPYYKHKIAMEECIKECSSNYYIFRLPQLVAKLIRHPTLINYLYYKILDGEMFDVYDEAYRYVIHIDDVFSIVTEYLMTGRRNTVLNVANPYAYNIREIINCLEIKAGKISKYTVTQKSELFDLDLSSLLAFTQKVGIDCGFGKDYLYKILGVKMI